MFEKQWMWLPNATAHFVGAYSVDTDPRGTGVDDLDFSLICGMRIQETDPGFGKYSFGSKQRAEQEAAGLCDKCLDALGSARLLTPPMD